MHLTSCACQNGWSSAKRLHVSPGSGDCSLFGFIITSTKVFVHRGMQPCVAPSIWLKEFSIKSITLTVTSLDA